MDTYQSARENLNRYRSRVEMSTGTDHDLVGTLKRVECYYNGVFEGPLYEGGLRKYFFNIVKPACDIATKFIDLDTKNVLLYSTVGGQEWKVWLMGRDLQQWMKDKKFGEFLNDLCFQLPKYGHFVCKKVKDGWKRVNLMNLRVDPSAPCLDESPFVYEVNMMSVRQLRSMPWDKEEVERLISTCGTQAHVAVYECYDMNPDTEGKKWKRTFKAGFLRKRSGDGDSVETPESQVNNKDEFLPGFVLHEDETDELPYRELKWDDVPGRWLGMGYVEYLFDNQIRINELTNVKARGLQLAALKLFQTGDEMIGRNVLTDLEPGDIIKTATGISQVDMTSHSLAEFQQEEQRWDMNTVQKTFSSDITRGEELPSGTPLGVARISTVMIDSYYAIKRENIGLFIKNLLVEEVLPSFKKTMKKAHVMRFFGSDKEIGKVHRAVSEHLTQKAMWDYALKTGTIPSAQSLMLEKARLESTLKRKKDVVLEIPDSFYDGIEFTLDITVTGEEMDVGGRSQTLQSAMAMVSSNPAILTTPPLRAILFKMLENSGFSPADLDMIADESDAMPPPEPQQAQGVTSMPKVEPQSQVRAEATL